MKNLFKNALVATAIFSAVSVGFVGCKKGANDPFLSLRSRKARVAGEWTISKSTYTSSSSTTSGSTTNTSTSSETFDGTTVTSSSSYNGVAGTATISTLSEKYTFEKDGTYTHEKTEVAGGGTETTKETGTWNFLAGVGDVKNKSQIVLITLTKVVTDASSTKTYTYTGANTSRTILDIDQLKNKEMIVKMEGSSAYTTTGYSSTSTWTGDFTFTQN